MGERLGEWALGTLDSVIAAVHQFLLNAYHGVNNLEGLVIALFAVVLMGSWRQLLPVALGASVVRLVIDAVVPVVQKSGIKASEIKLPDFMEAAFWNDVASLFVGFAIVIAMFFAVKKVVFMRGGRKKAKA